MNQNYIFALTIGIGVVAGLRSLTAPAVVSWAAHLGHLHLRASPLAFMGSAVTVGVFTLLALAELVALLEQQDASGRELFGKGAYPELG